MRTMENWLRCEETERAFTHCLQCKLPLVELAEAWLVNKEFQKDECVLEYAICQPCRDSVTNQLSEESKESVRRFLEQEIDWQERMREFLFSPNLVERFDACIACRTPRDETAGFAISALYDSGGFLTTGALPLLICHACTGRIRETLSVESRAVWSNFVNQHFSGPPDDNQFPGLF